MKTETIIVAIDGPSGVGKSTVGEAVARQLDLPYLETGAMYRALGWEIYQRGVDPEDRVAVEKVAEELDIGLQVEADGKVDVTLGGSELDARVRLPRVSEITSMTSSFPAVRQRMVALQRRFARDGGAVMEGRDIGTRVFPDTPHKFFLTAPLEVRVQRRVEQLERAGRKDLSIAAIEAEVAERDARDTQRAESPLTWDSSYTVIDTATMTAAEAVELIVTRIVAATSSRDDCC